MTTIATNPDTMLRLILNSRVYDVAHETPLEPAVRLSRRLGNQVLLKREDLQPIFSYKLRGAYNRIAHLTEAEQARGVIAASAGNHAQGVAFAARHLGLPALIVMPQTTPDIKVEAVRDMGADVVLYGDSYADARAHCDALIASTGMTFVPPFDDPHVIAGQGTVGQEILRHRLGDVDAIFVPVGGGGLIAGVASYVKAVRPAVRIVGVEPFEADAMYQSIAAGRRVALDRVGIFADGVAVREVGELTFPIVRDRDDRATTRRRAERRQHELRSPALRRRAGRGRGGARGAVRGHDPGASRRVPRVLRDDRPAGGDGVQLPAERTPARAHFRRHRDQ